MEVNTTCEERKELIDIYNSLTPSLKKNLLTLARVIDATQGIVLSEKKSDIHTNI